MSVRYVPSFDNRAIGMVVGLRIALGSPWAAARLLGSKPGDTIDVTVFALILWRSSLRFAVNSDDRMRWLFLTLDRCLNQVRNTALFSSADNRLQCSPRKLPDMLNSHIQSGSIRGVRLLRV
jgi:hypothetical protein